ncbi:MAG: hypothetical protein ABR570_10880 [Burkholderiales bacterium]
MQLSTIVAGIALLLAAALVAAYAQGQDYAPMEEVKTLQKKVDEREAQRRAAVAEQEKRKTEFAKRCTKPLKTAEELQECRAVYRQM